MQGNLQCFPRSFTTTKASLSCAPKPCLLSILGDLTCQNLAASALRERLDLKTTGHVFTPVTTCSREDHWLSVVRQLQVRKPKATTSTPAFKNCSQSFPIFNWARLPRRQKETYKPIHCGGAIAVIRLSPHAEKKNHTPCCQYVQAAAEERRLFSVPLPPLHWRLHGLARTYDPGPD